MTQPMFKGKHHEITEKIIGAYYDVYNHFGYGFNERVYENALAIEVRNRGFSVIQQQPIKVYFGGVIVGDYVADMIVDEKILIELKAVKALAKQHEAQLLNYLKATRIEVGLLFNFGPEAKYYRRIFENRNKGSLGWTQKSAKSV